MPYTGSRVKVRFNVKAEIFFKQRMYRKKVKMVQTQLSINNHSQSKEVGIRLVVGNKKYKPGSKMVSPRNPPLS